MALGPKGRSWPRTIGIVGGLGPHAHIAFEQQLLAAVGPVSSDQEYPAWMVSSLPATPDRTKSLINGGPSPVPWLVESLTNLEGRADFAVVTCNTAHAFLTEAQEQVRIPVLHVIRETVRELSRRYPSGASIGLLATTGTLRSMIYPATSAAIATNLEWKSLLDRSAGEEQQETLVMGSIYGSPAVAGAAATGGLKAGLMHDPRTGESYADRLELAADHLFRRGCSAVVLGCSEISLALTATEAPDSNWIDPMQIAAELCLRIAAGEAPLPSPWSCDADPAASPGR